VVVGDSAHLEDGVEETLVDLFSYRPGQQAMAGTGGAYKSAGNTL